MFQLGDQFLKDIGLGNLTDEQKSKFLGHFRKRLELMIGAKLSASLSDAQIREFEVLVDRGDDQNTQDWLQNNFPDYPQLVVESIEELKQDIIRGRDAILDNSSQ